MEPASASASKSYRGTMPIPVLLHESPVQTVPVAGSASQTGPISFPPAVQMETEEPIAGESLENPDPSSLQSSSLFNDSLATPPPPKKPFPWHLFVTMLALLLLIGGFAFAVYGVNRWLRPQPDNSPLTKASILTVSVGQTLTIRGNLTVTGLTDLQDLVVHGKVTLGNGTSFDGNLSVNGDGNFSGNITAKNFVGNGSGLTNLPITTVPANIVLLTPPSAQQGDISITGRLAASGLQGDGADVTNLNADHIATGTVSDNRLSANVAFLNTSNTFSGSNSFQAVTINALLTGVNATFTGNVAAASFTQNGNAVCDNSGNCGSSANDFTQGGNSFGAAANLGTNDNFGLNLRTNGVTRVSIDTSGNLGLGAGGSLISNRLAQTGVGNDISIDSGNDNIIFTAGGRVFTFPTSGPASQQICTTGIVCASGGGQAVLLAPGSAQTDNAADVSIFINDTGGGNLAQLQTGGVDKFVIDNSGNVTATSFAGSGSGLTSLNASNVSSGTLSDSRLSTNVTLQGNNFNGPSQLVQLNASTQLPAVSGINLTNLNASNIASGTLSDNRLSANVPLKNTANTFSALNNFTGGLQRSGNDVCDTSGNCSAAGGAGGDLTGSYPNPTIAKLQGTNLTITSPVGGHVLIYNTTNSRWENHAVSSDISINETGVATIATNAVTTTKIADSNVTNAKLQNSSLTVAAGTNLTGGGSVALGGSITLNVANSPTFSGTLTVQGATVSVGTTSQQGSVVLSDGSNNAGTFQTASLGQNTVYTLPDPGGAAASICLSTGNCSTAGAAGGDLTGTYPNPTIAKLQGVGLTIAGLTGGDFLQYNGTAWVNQSLSGDVNVASNGTATIQPNSVALTTDTTGNYVASIGTLTGLSTTGNTGEGSTPTLSVLYGATSNTAVQGNTTLTCPSGTGNLTGGGTSITLGTGGSCGNLSTVNNPTFTTSVTTPSMILTGAGSNGILQVANLGQVTTYTLPDPGVATASICLSTGNCAGAGGGITGSGTPGTIAKFSGSGTIGDSLLSESGSTVTISGTLGVNTITPTGALTIGNSGQKITLQGDSTSVFKATNGSFTTTVGFDTPIANITITTPALAAGSYNFCTTSGNCVGGGGGGAPNGAAYLTIGNDATLSNERAIAVNTTNLSVTDGGANGSYTINTIQDIATTSSPTFAGLTLSSPLTVANGGTGAGSFTSKGIIYGNGTGAFQVTAAGTSGQVLIAGATGIPAFVSLSGDVAVDNTGVTTIQANSVALGSDTTGDYVANLGTLTGLSTSGNSGEGSTPTLSVLYGATANTAVQGNTTLVCPSAAGNASLSGTGNTITLGSGGSCNALTLSNTPSFTSANLTGTSALTLGTASTNTGAILFYGSGSANSIALQSPTSPGSGLTLTLPNETGTLCSTGSVCAGYSGALTFNNGLTNTAGTVQLGGNLVQNTTIGTGNSFTTTITSDLSGGARSTAALIVSQANNATNNNTSNLVQFINNDTSSNSPLLSVAQNNLTATGISISGVTSGFAIDASSITSGNVLRSVSLTTGVGVNISGSLTTGIGLQYSASSATLTTGSAVAVIGSASGSLSGYTGSLINVVPTRTNTATSGTVTDSGNFLNLTRSNTQNGAGGTFAITGALANLQSNCTQTAGTCTDSANILSLNQQYANASGAVLSVQNSGNGDLVDFKNSLGSVVSGFDSGGKLFIGSITYNTPGSTSLLDLTGGSFANANGAQLRANKSLVVVAATNGSTGLTILGASGQTANLLDLRDNSGNILGSFSAAGQLNLGRASNTVGQANFFGSGSANSISLVGPTAPGSGLTLTLPNETGTLCSTGSVCSGYSGALTFNNGLTNTAGTVQLGGSLIQGTTLAAGNAQNLTITSDLSGGARSTYPLTISQANDATNDNSTGLLNLVNNDTGSTTAALRIDQVAGSTGASITGAYSVGIDLGGSVTTGTGILFNAGALTSGKVINVNLTSASLGAANVIQIAGSASSSSLSSFTGKLIDVSPTRTNTATSGTRTDSGNFLNLTRSNTQNGAGGTFAITGALANLQSNCTQTAGTCTDTANILSLNQQYANASGAVLNVQGAGTGNLASLDASNSSANGVSVDVQSSSNTKYALNVTSNNGSNNLIYAQADGTVGIGTNSPSSSYRLDVRNTLSITAGEHYVASFGTGTGGTDAQFLMGYTANGSAVTSNLIKSANSQPIAFATSSTNNALYLANAGNIGLSATSFGTNNRLLVNPYNFVDNAATAQINTTAIGNKGLVVQGFSGQTAVLFEAQNSGGTSLLSVSNLGLLRTGDTAGSGISVGGSGYVGFDYPGVANAFLWDSSTGNLTVKAGAASVQPVAIKGFAGQSADLLQLQDNSSNPIGGFNATGQLFLGRPSTTVGAALFYGSGSANSISLVGPTAPGSGLTLTLPNETGTLCSTGSVCAGYSGALTFNNGLTNTAGTVQLGGSLIQGTTLAAGNAQNLTITSDLSGGARSTYPLTISQANNASNNNSVGLLNLSNSDTGSTAAVLNVVQSATNGNAIDISGITNGTGVSVTSSGGTGFFSSDASGNAFASTTASGTTVASNNLTTGQAVSAGGNTTTSGIGLLFNTTATNASTSSALTATGSVSGTLANYTGSLINITPTRTSTRTSGTTTDSGNFLNLTRANIQNGAGGTFAITGALANLQSNCTQTAGTCTDSANILSLNQQYANASGAVLNISNSGTGSGALFNQTAGTGITLSTSTGSGLALSNLSTGTGVTFIAGALTTGKIINVNLTSTSLSGSSGSGSVLNVIGLASGALTSNDGSLISLTPGRTNTATTGTVTDTGSFLNLNRSNTQNGAGGTFAVTGALANLQSNCTQTAGTCTDSSNILALNQQYTSASGAVLNIANSGTGAGINIAQNPSGSAGINLAGTTNIGIALSNNTGTAINISGLTTGTGVSAGGVSTTNATGFLFNSTSTTYATPQAFAVSGSVSGALASFSGSWINVVPIRTLTSGSITDSGFYMNVRRNNTVNNAGSTFTVTGALANLQSNCTQTAGTCTDSANILSLNQQYANASGAVLLVQSSGTGNLLQVTDNTSTAKDVLVIADGGATTFKTQTDAAASFQIQNTAGNNVLSVDTSGTAANNFVTLGKASTLDGQLLFKNASNTNTVTLKSGVTSSAYTLTLPTALGSSGDCLKDTTGVGVLGFGSCGAGGSATLQTAYNTSAGAAPSILSTSANKAVTIQTANASGISAGNELFGVHLNQSGDTIGNSLFTVNSGGVGINIGGTGNPATTGDLTFGQGASRTINLVQATSGAGNDLTIKAGQGATGSIGGNLVLQAGANGSGGGTPGTVIVKANGANSSLAFQIQDSSGNELMTADTSASQVIFGKAGTFAGKLVVKGSTSGDVTIVGGSAITSYSIKLPTVAPSASQCLKGGASTATDLEWGSCGSGSGGGSTRKETLVPEYAGGVLSADGSNNSGTLTSTYDSTNLHNYYEWVNSTGTLNDYDVVVRNQIPSEYASGFGTFKIWAYGDSTSTSNNDIQVTVKDNSGTACATSTSVLPGSATTWTEQSVSLSGCTFAANDTVTIIVHVMSKSSNKVRIGEISYQYTN